MRFLKRILLSVLIYEAVFLPFVVIMQTVSGGDFTAAYTVGGAAASVELILCAIIKKEESKREKRDIEAPSPTGGSENIQAVGAGALDSPEQQIKMAGAETSEEREDYYGDVT